MNVKVWVYGTPFSGKSYLANTFPKPFVINTDGNLQYYDNADGVVVKNYDEFVSALGEFDNGNYDTLIIDVLDHVYDMSREHFLNENGIEHESDYQGDGAFGKGWTLFRDGFWYMISKIRNIDANVVLISHDAEKESKGKLGISFTEYKPATLPKAMVSKLAGLMHFVGRCYKDGDDYVVSFGSNDNELSGHRLKLESLRVGNTYEELIDNIGEDYE